MANILDFFANLKNTAFSIGIIDVIEILIMAFAVYKILVWMRNTRTWVVLKGIIAILLFLLVAQIFNLNTIKYILTGFMDIAIIAIIVIFQPELRAALETLGKGNIFLKAFSRNSKNVQESELYKMEKEIIDASKELARTKTGALIVIENEDPLIEFSKTGITLNADISKALLVNMFEHNTPLHDGAAIICGNKIEAATCYLPLSSSEDISKKFGTRHRAAIGVSEETDCITIIVSEETGKISLAKGGKLIEDISPEELKSEMDKIYIKTDLRNEISKRRQKNEETNS